MPYRIIPGGYGQHQAHCHVAAKVISIGKGAEALDAPASYPVRHYEAVTEKNNRHTGKQGHADGQPSHQPPPFRICKAAPKTEPEP